MSIKKQLAELALNRSRLLEKIEAQRLEVACISQIYKKPVVIVDIGITVVHFISRHPALVAGGFAVLLSLLRKGIAGLNIIIPAPVRFALSTIIFPPSIAPPKQDDSDLTP